MPAPTVNVSRLRDTSELAPPTERERQWRECWDVIAQDIYTAYFWRSTWLTVGDIVRANPTVRPSHYIAYLSSTYGSSEAVAVRRLADEHKDAVSLVTLIKDVRQHARFITADWWVGLQAGADIRDFRRFQASGTNHFDPAIAARDLAQLRAAVARVKKYVDHIAIKIQPRKSRRSRISTLL